MGLPKKKLSDKPIGRPEPIRKSLFDVIQENFKTFDRVIYVTRLLYIGDHSFKDDDINEFYSKIVKEVNSHYIDEKLTGLLVYYKQYFCIIIEGSEKAIRKHFEMLFSKLEKNPKMHRIKILAAHYNINKRFLDIFKARSDTPPTLLENLDPYAGIEETYRRVLTCVQKLYKLGIYYQPKPTEDDEEPSNDIPIEDPYGMTENPVLLYLPEYALLDFLLESKYLEDARHYYEMCCGVPAFEPYEEQTWPISNDHAPMDVFQVPLDPVVDFPPQGDGESTAESGVAAAPPPPPATGGE